MIEYVMDYDEYFSEVWSRVPEERVPQKFFEVNLETLKNITFDLYRFSEQRGKIDLQKDSMILTSVCQNIIRFGIFR